MEWNGDLNPTDLDGRTQSYGARKRCGLFCLLKPTTCYLVKMTHSVSKSITFKFCKPGDQECNFNDL